MYITSASASTPGRINEDYVCTGGDWAVILDGATAPPRIDSGCVHGVPWIVRQLTARVAYRLALADMASLPDILAAAIKGTCRAHADTCDLTNPNSPSSTVSMLRLCNNSLDYLTLGDSPIILWHTDHSFTPIIDDRTSHLPGGRPYTLEVVQNHRNKAGGFWVASTNTDAAYQAISGSVEVSHLTEAALFTDGITRLLDWYGYTWPEIFGHLRENGPVSLISLVRAEEAKGHPFGKQHDDASVIYWNL